MSAASNSNNGSYGNEKPPQPTGMVTGSGGGGSTNPDPEFVNDPAFGSFFSSDYKRCSTFKDILKGRRFMRHEDLKTMLDSNKDGLKLEAMKRIIGMVAKGKDASDLFPAVVKNVVSKNIEVKKLVYVYLVRYAEEQQDLALLSISTFQRALKDPNQLIRASALRVLSSVRVPVIIPIMMLAIKDAVNDMSPYVRKTVAHAIPKLYSLDPEQKDQLIEVIEKLLSDKTTLVVGSAVMAFEEVCPERIDLIHKNYRKLCNLLVDVEEWGQVIIMRMLTRYCRTQFVDPNRDDVTNDGEEKPFYEDEDQAQNDDEATMHKEHGASKNAYVMDPDHRLLLRVAKPLLQSRNAAVVMSVAQLYHHLAPKSEVTIVAKSLIRLLRGYREVQSVVLSNIATMSIRRKGMFEPYLKSFFIRTSDPTHIKQLKLEILTNLASDTSISTILREFQTYVSSADKEFVASTIQAIGRCASNIKEVTDTCLNGLVSLMSNRSEAVVAESVVVIKKLLQMQPSEHKDIIVHMTRLIDTITVPMARASILWLLGEYSDHVPKIAPDVLRKMAKTFIHEEDIVKLQVLTLATKLYLSNSKQTKLLCQYVFNLAKYDQNYDIRDRSRFLRQLVFPSGDQENVLTKHCKTIFLSTKPAPLLESKFKDRDQYQLGSLAHFTNMRVNGYADLPDFPEVAPDPSVRNVEVLPQWSEPKKKKQLIKKKSFYSETETSSVDEEDETGSSDESNSDSDSESYQSGASSDTEEDSDSSTTRRKGERKKIISNKNEGVKKVNRKVSHSSEESDIEEESESDEDDSGESTDEESSDSELEKQTKKEPTKNQQSKPPSMSSNIDLLLDLNEISESDSTKSPFTSAPITPTMLTPTPSTVTSARPAAPIKAQSMVVRPALYVPTKSIDLINKIASDGLGVTYRFTRSTNLYSPKMASVEFALTNHGDEPITNIKLVKKKLAPGMDIHPFADIDSLAPGLTVLTTLGIDFNETTQPACFDIVVNDKPLAASIKAPIGELLQPIDSGEHEFLTQQNKLKGLNENSITCDIAKTYIDKSVANRIYEVANVAPVLSANADESLQRFAAQAMSSKSLVLLTVAVLDNGKASVTVNCEKMVIGSMLLKEIKMAFSN